MSQAKVIGLQDKLRDVSGGLDSTESAEAKKQIEFLIGQFDKDTQQTERNNGSKLSWTWNGLGGIKVYNTLSNRLWMPYSVSKGHGHGAAMRTVLIKMIPLITLCKLQAMFWLGKSKELTISKNLNTLTSIETLATVKESKLENRD